METAEIQVGDVVYYQCHRAVVMAVRAHQVKVRFNQKYQWVEKDDVKK